MKRSLPLKRRLGQARAASLVAAAAAVPASAFGLGTGAGRYASSQSVLVSQGADMANLIAVLLVLVALWLASRGSRTALLLWPGGLLSGLRPRPVPGRRPVHTAALRRCRGLPRCRLRPGVSRYGNRRDGPRRTVLHGPGPSRRRHSGCHRRSRLRLARLHRDRRLRQQRDRGCLARALGRRLDPGHTSLDHGGILLWARRPFGYPPAPGPLLASALGGVVFAASAFVDNLVGGIQTDPSVVVHLVINAASAAVLVWFLVAPSPARADFPKPCLRHGAAPGAA